MSLVSNVKKVTAEIKKPLDDIDEKINKVTDSIKEVKEHNKRMDAALLALQRRSILDACEGCLKKGYATINDRETISAQLSSYEELGGNSFIHDLWTKVEALPLEKKVASPKNRLGV